MWITFAAAAWWYEVNYTTDNPDEMLFWTRWYDFVILVCNIERSESYVHDLLAV